MLQSVSMTHILAQRTLLWSRCDCVLCADGVHPAQLLAPSMKLLFLPLCRSGTLPGMRGPASYPCPEMAAAGITHRSHPNDPAYHTLFHPKSFAANFIFNTNIWAAKDRQLQVLGSDMFLQEGFFPYWWRAAERWFPASADKDDHEFGLPWVSCQAVPPLLQVAHRCRCRDWDVCGQHQVAVQICMQKNQTGYVDLENTYVR